MPSGENISEPTDAAQAQPGTAVDARGMPAALSGLVTMRMVAIFSMLRRAEILAHKKLFGLSEIEWQIITFAGERPPLSLNRLAGLTRKDEGQLSRAVKKMCARELLIRRRKPGGPEIEIELSAEGRSVYRTMVERVIARERWLTAEITAEDLEALWRASDIMIVKARQLVEDQDSFTD